MGDVDVLRPQDCLIDHRLNLVSVSPMMKNRRVPRFNLSETTGFTASEARRRSPPKGILKKKDRDATPAAKDLVLGHVKILKRGEVLNEPTTCSKDLSDREALNGAASTLPPSHDSARDWKAPKPVAGYRKKKAEKERKRSPASNPNPKPNSRIPKPDVFALSSTDRLGPDPDMVPELFFAGSAFYDSPPPSSVPLPGFYRKNLSAAVNIDPTTDLRRILGLSLP